MDFSGQDTCEKWSGSHPDAPELRLVLVGNIGCGKTLTADNLLGQTSSSVVLSPSKLCEVRRGVSEGRRLTVVETPRWYWSGQHLESSVQRETERALSLTAPGPHAFLILVPVGEFTEMEQRVPTQLERTFGTGALNHAMVLLTCGDYLLGRDMEQYMMKEEPHLKAMVDSCGGHWHVINNRRPQDRQQVISLLEKVEQLAQSNRGCYLQSVLQREVEARVREKERELQRRYSLREEERFEMAHIALAQPPQKGGIGVFRSQSREEVKENVTSQQLPNGLHSQPSPGQKETATGPMQRSSSFKLTKEGAILSQMSEKTEASVNQSNQSNQSFINTIHHRFASSGDPSSPELTVSSSSSAVVTSSSSSLSSNYSASDLRLVLLGQTGSGKSTAGNAILGREVFKLRRNVTGATTQQFARGTAVVGYKQVAVVDTPDWFWSGCSPGELKAHQSSCTALCSPGPHAFLLCVPVTHPGHSILHGLPAIEDAFGSEALLKRTLVLFTYSDLLGGGVVEEYIAKKRPEMLELVEKCGDHYHVLERGKTGGREQGKVEELLEKVEQLVKETGGSCYSIQQQPEHMKKQEDIARERTTPLSRERGEKQLDETDRAISTMLHSLKEEDEDEEEVKKSMKPEETMTSSSSRLGSILRFVGEKVGAGAKRVPKLVAGGALLGGAVGLFFGGPLGGAVGVTAGSVAAEVGRRKYGKSKTD
ncbi:hypothetical protein AOLI_G00002950 [Acnodon oligacanthus]